MAYSAPTTRAAGYKVPATVWNQDVVDNVTFLANPPACRVTHSVNQSIADNTETTVAFDTETFDTNSMHDPAVSNSRITFSTAGIYVVQFSGRFEAGTDYDYLQTRLRLNGATVIALTSSHADTTASFEQGVDIMTLYKFAAADYVEVRVYQDNAANAARNLLASAINFSACWIGLG